MKNLVDKIVNGTIIAGTVVTMSGFGGCSYFTNKIDNHRMSGIYNQSYVDETSKKSEKFIEIGMIGFIVLGTSLAYGAHREGLKNMKYVKKLESENKELKEKYEKLSSK